NPAIALGTTQQFTATGTFSDSSTQDLTAQVTWSSSNTGVATIDNSGGNEGLATSVAVGTCTITALHVASSISGSTSLQVTPAVLVSLAVTPQAPWVLAGTTRQFTATGTYSDASTQDLTDQVTWSSATTAAATISNAGGTEGLLTGVAAGSSVITALHVATSIQNTATATVIDQIEQRSAASGGANTGVLSLTINTPADREVGDLLLAVVAIRPYTAAVTPPSGWTLVRRVDNSNSADHSLLIYRRAVAADEPTDHTFTFSASTGSAGGISCFSGVNLAAPVDVESGQNTASGLSHASPSVVTGATDEMVFTAHGMSSASDWTPPVGMTEAFDARSSVATMSTGICVCGCYAVQSAAGATGARMATAAGDADVGNTAIVVLARAP
ncbi:MAG: Ig-like domain-containing protein, partial [Planctomycetes bacterium]|nr:Ig-like domain-containing protein [Planctomycetota bacterium]